MGPNEPTIRSSVTIAVEFPMPYDAGSERKLSAEDWSAIAEWGVAEKQTRKNARRDLEKQWGEIDRQLAMKAKGRTLLSGQQNDWYPALEEPLQFNALEVIEADVLAGIFPPTQPSWYQVTGDTSEDYFRDNEGAEIVEDGIPTKLDQESVDAIVKATIDYYHECYDFRMRVALWVAEMIKYGTGPGRVKMVTPGQFTYEYRDTGNYKGPAFLPYSIRNTYLDDTPALVMHEGITVAPLLIRTENRLYDDLKIAIEKGGSDRGWNADEFARLEPKKGKDKRGTVDLIEMEGDLIVPRSGGKDSLVLPNTRTLIGVSGGGPAVIRFQANSESWHSHIIGYYMRQDVDSAYGVSPLMKGWPVQEAASFVLNDVLATSALSAKPPIPYDRNDSQLVASGGPDIYPGAQWPADNPQALVPMKVANATELFNVYAGLIKKYEELTQANDPRRGAGVKSHTTTGAHQLDTMRSLVRTEKFTQDICDGPLASILYMEYAMIRDAVGSGKYIPIDASGMKGFIKVTKKILPKRVSFRVFGSAGVADQMEKKQSFFAAANFAIQLYAAAVQTGKPVDIDFVALITEAFEIAGHQDAARFVRRSQAVSQGTPGTSAVPGGGEVDTSTLLGSLQALQGA